PPPEDARADTRADVIYEHISGEAAASARSTLVNRCRLKALLGSSSVSDPAWEILLELFVAALDQERVQTSSVGLIFGIAPTTASRWIGALEAKGLIYREADGFHGRRVYVALTDEGLRL